MTLQHTARIFVNTLSLPSSDEVVARFLHPAKQPVRTPASRWCIDESLSAADLYIYLKARFGPPNGAMMAVRAPHSNNLIQWHFTLKSGKFYVDFVGMNTRTEIWIQGYQKCSSADWAAVVKALKDDFHNFGPQMKNIRKALEKWQLFSNPFKRLDRVISKYKEELESFNNNSLQWPREPDSVPGLVKPGKTKPRADLNEYLVQFTVLSETVWRAVELSTCLRVLTPIWAESFINFLIFLTAKPEIKNDDRLFEDFIRKVIDIRIKLLPVNCVGFVKKFDIESEVVKKFLTVMNERNDILHGNIRPGRVAFETVYFDDMIPLFTEPHGLTKVSLINSLKGIEPVKTIENVKVVEHLMAYILSRFSPPIHQEISLCLHQRDLGWRQETKRIGVLFPDYVVDGFIG
jgi:hypothetical protein